MKRSALRDAPNLEADEYTASILSPLGGSLREP